MRLKTPIPLLSKLHAQTIIPPVLLFHLKEHRVRRVIELHALDVAEARCFEFGDNGLEVPHPEMTHEAPKEDQEPLEVARSSLVTQASVAHEFAGSIFGGIAVRQHPFEVESRRSISSNETSVPPE
jgi:hypothetical protein